MRYIKFEKIKGIRSQSKESSSSKNKKKKKTKAMVATQNESNKDSMEEECINEKTNMYFMDFEDDENKGNSSTINDEL